MNHHHFITLKDGTEITYSDLKINNDGNKYISLYFETPTDSGFKSAYIDYPSGKLYNIVGYSDLEQNKILYHYKKVAKIAFDLVKES